MLYCCTKKSSDYYPHSFTSSFHDPSKFGKDVKSISRNNSSCPTHIGYGHSPLTGREEICTAFNSHFAASGHLFDSTMCELIYNLKPQAELEDITSPPSFSMSSFSLGEVIDVILTIDTRKQTHIFNYLHWINLHSLENKLMSFLYKQVMTKLI